MGHSKGTHVVSSHIKFSCKCGISKVFILERQLNAFKKLHGKYCVFGDTTDTGVAVMTFNASKCITKKHSLGEIKN
jgi:hypothetical protein